jgi:hypothetical protein
LDVRYIQGPIEVLGTGKPSGVPDSGPRTLAAYRVQLPDGLAPRLVLMNAPSSCSNLDPVLRPGGGGAVQELGVLRRVGDETHFFLPLGDGSYVDTETTTAFASHNGRSTQLVVAVSPNDSRVLSCGELKWLTTASDRWPDRGAGVHEARLRHSSCPSHPRRDADRGSEHRGHSCSQLVTGLNAKQCANK